jgi:hypothetical protein
LELNLGIPKIGENGLFIRLNGPSLENGARHKHKKSKFVLAAALSFLKGNQ